jgi:hypothetical protein
MVDYSFPEGLLTPLAVNHFQVTGYTLSPTAWAHSTSLFTLLALHSTSNINRHALASSMLNSPV